MVLASRRRAGCVGAVVVHPHERGVHAPAEDDLRDHLDGQQQRQHAVVAGRQEPDVDRQQQEADRLRGDIARAVHRQVAAECLQSAGTRTAVRRCRAAEGQQVEEATAARAAITALCAEPTLHRAQRHRHEPGKGGRQPEVAMNAEPHRHRDGADRCQHAAGPVDAPEPGGRASEAAPTSRMPSGNASPSSIESGASNASTTAVRPARLQAAVASTSG